ncbi:MAG: hypothetical protein ABI947_29310 [Chloroflexota bacterium]
MSKTHGRGDGKDSSNAVEPKIKAIQIGQLVELAAGTKPMQRFRLPLQGGRLSYSAHRH